MTLGEDLDALAKARDDLGRALLKSPPGRAIERIVAWLNDRLTR